MNFGVGPMPRPNTLVNFDGHDELDKQGALDFFSKKTWEDVFSWLKDGNYYNLEELTCLEHEPLQYYFRAYLEYALHTLFEEDPNDDFLAHLFSEFYQLKYMNKYGIFSENRRKVLNDFSGFVKQSERISLLDEYGKDWILRNIDRYERSS